jgi:hypothetical protein
MQHILRLSKGPELRIRQHELKKQLHRFELRRVYSGLLEDEFEKAYTLMFPTLSGEHISTLERQYRLRLVFV